jgi:flagellar basal-body rod modification protein FlgD
MSNQTLPAGSQKFTWDGKTSTGTAAAPGEYKLHITARDASGQDVTVKTELMGVVESVEVADGEPVLVMGTNRVPLGNVRSITWPVANKE